MSRILDEPSIGAMAPEARNVILLADGRPSSVDDGEGRADSSPLLGSSFKSPSAFEVEYGNDWGHLPWYRRPTVWILLPAFSLAALAYGGVAVPRLNIIISLICQDHYREQSHRLNGDDFSMITVGETNKQCQTPEIQAIVSKVTLGMALISGILSAFICPRLGSLSDRHGRRYFMAASAIGMFTSEVTTILATKYPEVFSVNIFFVGAVIDGLCGSFMLGMALSYSYGADCTAPRKRAMVFGVFQGCLFLGIALGPVLGGLLIEATGNMLSVFYVALCLHAFFFLYVILLLPESLSKRRIKIAREKYNKEHGNHGVGKEWWESVNPVNLVRPLNILFPIGEGSSTALRLNLLLLAAIDTIILGVGIGGMTVIIMYSEKTFDWENLQSSVFVSIVNSTRVTMLFVILPLTIVLFRRHDNATRDLHHGSDKLDIRLIQFSVFVETFGYILYAVAPSGVLFTLAGAITALGGIGSPTVQSSLTKHIPADKTGQLLGATALLHSLARVVAPAIFNLIYASTVATFPQTVFVCLASGFGLATLLSGFIRPGVYLKEKEMTHTAQDEEEADAEVLPSVVE